MNPIVMDTIYNKNSERSFKENRRDLRSHRVLKALYIHATGVHSDEFGLNLFVDWMLDQILARVDKLNTLICWDSILKDYSVIYSAERPYKKLKVTEFNKRNGKTTTTYKE